MTHPVWWQDKILPPRLKVVSCLKDKVRIMKSYDNILKKWQAKCQKLIIKL